jgi:cytochrome c oxidase subunit I
MDQATSAALAAPYLTRRDGRIILTHLLLAFAAFAIGILAGLAQALDRVMSAKTTLWTHFPLQENYYQGLTAHGVLLAIVFTFAFSNGFMTLVMARSTKRAPVPLLHLASLVLLVVGALMAAWQIAANKASVLYTMYPPLKATWIYYLGLVLVVVSTWVTGLNVWLAYRAWRKEHPRDRIPLQTFGIVATYTMWFIASLGVAVEALVLLIPWALGVVDKVDPQLARVLFWFSGHPLVYFWLLPAYVSWYTMIPRQVGGKILSDALVRVTFIMFLILSIPTGFHHQFTDPGITPTMKAIQAAMTFAIFFPSMLTAFSVVSSLESGGRRAGGKGLLGWIRKLPWGEPSVVAQILAMCGFVLGGISGLVNASYSVNLVIHNTAWVPGHFHLTVGTAVALSFMGITYWLVSFLTGRELWGKKVAVTQAWLWLAGVCTFSLGQVNGGLDGMPRRLNVSQLTYGQNLPAWHTSHVLTAIGGSVMFISGSLFLIVLVATLLVGRKGVIVDIPVAEEFVSGPQDSAAILDRWPVWIGVAILFILIAYGPFFLTYVPNFVSSGLTPW